MSFKGFWTVFMLASLQMCIIQKGEIPGSRLGAVGVDGAWVRSCPRGVGNQAARRLGCPDAGPDAAADAVGAAADVREGLRVVYALKLQSQIGWPEI